MDVKTEDTKQSEQSTVKDTTVISKSNNNMLYIFLAIAAVVGLFIYASGTQSKNAAYPPMMQQNSMGRMDRYDSYGPGQYDKKLYRPQGGMHQRFDQR